MVDWKGVDESAELPRRMIDDRQSISFGTGRSLSKSSRKPERKLMSAYRRLVDKEESGRITSAQRNDGRSQTLELQQKVANPNHHYFANPSVYTRSNTTAKNT